MTTLKSLAGFQILNQMATKTKSSLLLGAWGAKKTKSSFFLGAWGEWEMILLSNCLMLLVDSPRSGVNGMGRVVVLGFLFQQQESSEVPVGKG